VLFVAEFCEGERKEAVINMPALVPATFEGWQYVAAETEVHCTQQLQ
jgi:hypothetical protein